MTKNFVIIDCYQLKGWKRNYAIRKKSKINRVIGIDYYELTNKQQFVSVLQSFEVAYVSFQPPSDPERTKFPSGEPTWQNCKEIIYSLDWLQYANQWKPIAIDNNRREHKHFRVIIDWSSIGQLVNWYQMVLANWWPINNYTKMFVFSSIVIDCYWFSSISILYRWQYILFTISILIGWEHTDNSRWHRIDAS